ncbi:MAG: glycoside hydrolase family 2, partial [Hymenobacter sp.]
MDDLAQSNYGLSAPPSTDSTAETDNSLPRAVLRSGTHFLLDGTWRFALDPDDAGLIEEWQEGHDYRFTAQWPGSIEEHIVQAH